MSRILVTGANGFIGRHVVRMMEQQGHQVRRAVRQAASPGSASDTVVIGSIGPTTDWRPALEGVNAVIHLAARVHVMRETAALPLEEFRRVNVGATERLARAAVEMGVRRVVYASSVKVNGDETTPSSPFHSGDAPRPHGPYAVSKAEAESALRSIADSSGLEIVVIRPVLTYGEGVAANFLQLLRLVDTGIPLPFASVDNLRDMVYVGNLAGLLACCAVHPAAAGATFLACDGRPLSTPEWIGAMARALGRKTRLFRLSTTGLRAIARLARREGAFSRLCGSLRVDGSLAGSRLNWRPPFTVEAGLDETARWYLDGHASAASRA